MNENTKGKKEKRMAILTAGCKRAFVVAPEKSKEFLDYKSVRKTKNDMDKIMSKISVKVNPDERK